MTSPRIGIAAGMIKETAHVPFGILPLLDHVTFGSYTREARTGNSGTTTWYDPKRRLMLNAIGLKNGGLLTFLDDDLLPVRDAFNKTGTKLRVSLAPTYRGELADCVRLLNAHQADEAVDELEINSACPNHRTEAGLEPILCHDMTALKGLLKEAGDYLGRKALKIAPQMQVGVLPRVIELCEAYDIHTIVSGNTLRRLSTADNVQRLSQEYGGMSGISLLPDTKSQVGMLTNLIEEMGADIEIIACGGVMEADAAVNLLTECGATSVQVATLFWNHGPDALARLVQEAAFLLPE